jgi:hypothetical protein
MTGVAILRQGKEPHHDDASVPSRIAIFSSFQLPRFLQLSLFRRRHLHEDLIIGDMIGLLM